MVLESAVHDRRAEAGLRCRSRAVAVATGERLGVSLLSRSRMGEWSGRVPAADLGGDGGDSTLMRSGVVLRGRWCAVATWAAAVGKAHSLCQLGTKRSVVTRCSHARSTTRPGVIPDAHARAALAARSRLHVSSRRSLETLPKRYT